MDINEDELLQVGALTQPHGVHGEVKVFPTTDDVKRFKKNKDYILKNRKGELIPVHVKTVKFFKQFVILGFEEFDTPEEMAMMKQCPLFVTRENAVKLAGDEFFIADLIGLSAYNVQTGELLGEVTDVLQTGANDVYVVTLPGGDDVLFPAIKECVKRIDTSAGRMELYVMPGLVDDDAEEAPEEDAEEGSEVADAEETTEAEGDA